MRVISGKFKGRRLKEFSAGNIRPTTDRVKESLFNILAPHIEGAQVLDLFSGTGSLAIEAYSREAKSVTAVENHPKSLAIIRENLDLLKINQGIKILPLDVFRFLKNYDGQPFDLILVDPPFTQVLGHLVLEDLAKSKAVGLATQVAIETAKKERVDSAYAPLTQIDRREFGDKILTFFACPAPTLKLKE